jgi:hypothetical protein
VLGEEAFGGVQEAILGSHTFVSIIRMNYLLSRVIAQVIELMWKILT